MAQIHINNLTEGDELEISSYFTIKNIDGQLYRVMQTGGGEDTALLTDDQKEAIEAAQDIVGTVIGGYEASSIRESHGRIFISFEKNDGNDETEDTVDISTERYLEFLETDDSEGLGEDYLFREEFVRGSEERNDGPH